MVRIVQVLMNGLKFGFLGDERKAASNVLKAVVCKKRALLGLCCVNCLFLIGFLSFAFLQYSIESLFLRQNLNSFPKPSSTLYRVKSVTPSARINKPG